MIFSSSKCAELLENGTFRTLVSLLNSHVIYQSKKSPEEIAREYMKKANLKKNIFRAMNDIVNREHALNPEMRVMEQDVKTTSSGTAWELTFFNHLSIFKILKKVRKMTDWQYANDKSLETQKRVHSKQSHFGCFWAGLIEADAVDNNAAYRNIFEQLGGPYVFLDLLQTYDLFFSKTCNKNCEHCELLLANATRILDSFCYESNSTLTRTEFCRQLAGSPFHITMFVNLIRQNRSNFSIVHSAATVLTEVFKSVPIYDLNTLQDCQAVPLFTEIMMLTSDDDTRGCMFLLLSFVLSANVASRREFVRIEGAVSFVISTFIDHHSWLIDGFSSEEHKPRKRTYLDFSKNRMLLLMQKVTSILFPVYPKVQDLIWDANVSTFLIKLIQTHKTFDYPKYEPTPNEWLKPEISVTATIEASFVYLYYILVASQRERDRVSQIIKIEFFREMLNILSINDGTSNTVRLILGLLEN